MAAALIDRLVHDRHLVTIRGNSDPNTAARGPLADTARAAGSRSRGRASAAGSSGGRDDPGTSPCRSEVRQEQAFSLERDPRRGARSAQRRHARRTATRSTDIVLRAGQYEATSATAMIIAAMNPYVAGSTGATAYSRGCITRDSAAADARPNTRPMAARD